MVVELAGFFALKWVVVCVGTQRAESEYLFGLVHRAATRNKSGRTIFNYHVGPVSVCRGTFCVILGLSFGSSRIKKYETLVRKGWNALPPFSRKRRSGTSESGWGKEEVAGQYIAAHFLVQADKSPSEKIMYIEKPDLVGLFQQYKDYFNGKGCVEKSTFKRVYYERFKEPVVDPATGDEYLLQTKKRWAVGFRVCDKCASLKFAIAMAKKATQRMAKTSEYRLHLKSVRADRDNLAGKRVECNGITIVGFSVDAVDHNKFPTPTTKYKGWWN